MRAKIFIAIVLIVFISGLSFAAGREEARSLFLQGNENYANEKFEEAIASYEKAANLGFESGELYYNLGNAYFKYGSLGKAIVNYKRAKRLMPQDADLKSNLSYANSLIKGGGAQSGRIWPARMFFGMADSLGLDKVTEIGTVFYSILAGLLVAFIIFKRFRGVLIYLIIPAALLTALFVSLFIESYREEFYRKKAVIITKSTDAKFEPFIGATTFFILKEGEDLYVIDSDKDWLKIRRIDGKQAWIKKADVEFVIN